MSAVKTKELYSDYKYVAHGGFSRVYQAKNSSGETVAIKKIPLIEFKMIQRELSLLKECNSKYIIKLLNQHKIEADDEYWIVLEFCSGGSIQSMAGKCNENELRKIVNDALHGLKYLHSKDIVHRDIKPENILYHQESNVYKLGDFGCSKNTALSTARTTVGTSAYKSPEMVNGQSVGLKSDIWALGITVYFLATNEYPFDANIVSIPFKLMLAISQGNVAKLGDKKDKIFTENIKNFINNKCLMKNPTQRESAEKLLKHAWIIEEEKDEKEQIEKLQNQLEKMKNELKQQQKEIKRKDLKLQNEAQKMQKNTK